VDMPDASSLVVVKNQGLVISERPSSWLYGEMDAEDARSSGNGNRTDSPPQEDPPDLFSYRSMSLIEALRDDPQSTFPGAG